MSDLSDREKGFERRFEQDQERDFRIKARRNHLLGLWAAAQLGLSGEAALSYARNIADPAQHLHGDSEIVSRIVTDFAAKSLPLDAVRIAFELERCDQEARKFN